MIITRHVAVTNDGRYVEETHPDAAFLAYSPGAEVSDEVVAARGLSSWVAPVHAVRGPSVLVGRDARGQPVMTPTRITPAPVGTIPPGHATASHPGVPAETAAPVANADGTQRGEVAVVVSAPAPASQQTTRTTAGKPARTTREV